MKLHLPTRLRAAVLACFAVVTSFTTTLATGAIAGGAFAVALVGSQAMAAYDEATATITGTASAGVGGIVMSNLTVPDGQTLTFAIDQNVAQTYFNGTQTYSGDVIIDDKEAEKGLVITDGNAGNIITFSGAVTGGGVMYKKGNGTGNTWDFTGDVSGYTGNIKLGSTGTGANFKIRFSSTNNSTSTDGVSGTGDITFESDLNSLGYDFSGGSVVYITNAISATNNSTARVVLSGTDEVVFTKSVTIHELRGVITTGNSSVYPTGNANASSITFDGADSVLGKTGKTNTITGQLKVGSNGSLTLAGTVALQQSATNNGTLTLGGTLDLSAVTWGDAAVIQGTGSVHVDSGLLVELGESFVPEGNKEYVIFGEGQTVSGWDAISLSNFRKGGAELARTVMTMTAQGFTLSQVNYTDMTTAGTQTWDYTSSVWNTAQDAEEGTIAFVAGDSVVFSADAALTVQSSGVEAGTVTISGEGTEVSLTEGFVKVQEGVLVGNGATLTLNTQTGSVGYIRGAVTVQSGGTLCLNASDVTGYESDNTHTVNIEEGGKLVLNIGDNSERFRGTLNLDGTLKGSGVWALYGGSAGVTTGSNKNAVISTGLRLQQASSVFSVGSGSTLTVSGAVSREGDGGIGKQGAGKLQLAGESDIGNVVLHGGTMELSGGGALGDTEIKGGTSLVFSGEEKTYSVGAILANGGDNFNRNMTVGEGVIVNVAANGSGKSLVNSWGLGTVCVDGTLNLAGQLFMSSGRNDSMANNLITGSGVLNAASLDCTNVGTYNFSIHELNISGAASISQFVNILGGTVNLNGTSGFYNRTVIDGGSLNLVGAFKGNGNGVIDVNSGALTFKSTATAEGYDNTLRGLNVAKGATVTVDTDAVATITAATLAAPIINKGNLTLSGTLTVSDLTGFTPVTVGGGSPSYVDADGNTAENGYLSGERRYTLIENTGTLSDDAITSVSGVGGTYADGVLTVTGADMSVFYVNTTVDAAALGEGKKYCINGGTLNVGTDGDNILQTAVGTDGVMKLTSNAALRNNQSTGFGGKLTVESGATLTIGQVGAINSSVFNVNLTSLSALELNGGTIEAAYAAPTIPVLNVTATSVYKVDDIKAGSAATPINNLNLSADLTLQTNWKSNFNIGLLTGAGNLNVRQTNGSESNTSPVVISGINNYTGVITVGAASESSKLALSLNISKGQTISSDKLVVAGTNASAVLLGGGTYNVGSTLALGDRISLGNDWAGTVAASGVTADGTLSTASLCSTASSKLSISGLTVIKGAALTLGGIGRTELSGEVVLNEAIVAGSSNISFASGASIDLTGLSATTDGDREVLTLFTGEAVDLSMLTSSMLSAATQVMGTDWAFGSDGRITYKAVDNVRYYWENGNDSNNYFAHGKWSLTDDDSTNTVSLPADMRKVVLVYSNAGTSDSPNIMRLNTVKSVKGVEVVNGYYRFWTDEGTGSLACSSNLSLSSNGHLILDLPMSAANLNMEANSELIVNKTFTLTDGGDVTVTGSGAALKLGNGQNLTADALDISTAGASLALSATGNADSANAVTLNSISLGEGSGLTLRQGTSRVTVAASRLTLAANASLVVEAGQVLDLTAIDYTGESGSFADLLNAASGAGTLKAAASGSVVLRKDAQLRTNLEIAALELNSWRETNPGKKVEILSDGGLDVENTLIIESTAAVNVLGGSLEAGNIKLGHSQSGNYGYLTLSSGSITTSGISVQNSRDTGSSFTMTGGTLDISGTAGISAGIVTSMTGGTLKASGTNGWGVTGATVGGVTVDAASAGKVTLTDASITGDITGNGKLTLAGTVNATAHATVSGVNAGGITVTTADACELTLSGTSIDSTITNNGELTLSGTQNVTMAANSSYTLYSDTVGGSVYGDNGYRNTHYTYNVVDGNQVTVTTGTVWQLNGETRGEFDAATGELQVVEPVADGVYFIRTGTVEYTTGAGCLDATTLQLNGGSLVLTQTLDTTVTTSGIVVGGQGTQLQLDSVLSSESMSLESAASVSLSGSGTLQLGTTASLAEGVLLNPEAWEGTVQVSGAALSSADLSSLGVSGSTIELADTAGTLTGGTYAAAVKLTNGSEIVLGAGNTFDSLDSTAGTLKVTGKNSISSLTLADDATLDMDFTQMGLTDLSGFGADALLTVGELNVGTTGGMLNLTALASRELLLTMTHGQSITLADIAVNNASLGLLLDDGTTVGSILKQEDRDGYEYTYTLTEDTTTGHTLVQVSAKLIQSGWKGDENAVWTNTDSIGGMEDNWEDNVGVFCGYGSGTVNIDTAGVDVSDKTVLVSAAEHTTDYTFEGGSLVADKLAVSAGSLTINNESVNTLTTAQVSGYASLTVKSGKELHVGTDMAVLNQAVFTNHGSTTVQGTLSVAETATVSNNRKLIVGAISAENVKVNSTGSLIIGNGGGIIGTLSGDGYLENSGLLTIQNGTTVQALANKGDLTVNGHLEVISSVDGGGKLTAASANFVYANMAELNVSGAVKANSLTVEKAEMGSLETNALTSIGGDTVKVVTDATIGNFNINGLLEVGGTLKVTGVVSCEGEVSAANAELANVTLRALNVTGTVTAGTLKVKNLKAGALAAESLTITGGHASVGSSSVLDAYTNLGGTAEIMGDLTVNSSVEQGGTLVAENVVVNGTANFSSVTTGQLTTTAATLTNATVTTLTTDGLTVNAGGVVTVSDSLKLKTLSGTGTLRTLNGLTLTEQVSSSVKVETSRLELLSGGSTLGSVLTDTIIMGESLTLNASEALLTVESLGSFSGDSVNIGFGDAALDALFVEDVGRYGVADYLIIDGIADFDSFVLLDSPIWEAINQSGMDAALKVSNGGLYLSITALTDEEGEVVEQIWDTTGGNTETNLGAEIDTKDSFYKALNYVKQVLVSEDSVVFDLADAAVGSADKASDSSAGLLVRNLSGGGALTIRGNSAELDVASVFNTKGQTLTEDDAVELTVDAATVNLGLPEGSLGKMAEDRNSEAPTLAALSLTNGAQVNVNGLAEILGDTDLADDTRLNVTEGNTLTTGMLSGTDKATLSGDIRVCKGGVYTGAYDGATITAAAGSNLRLRTGARSGAGLVAESGSSVTLDSAGQSGSLDSLRVGESPVTALIPARSRMAAAEGAELNLLNATVTDDGVKHHTLALKTAEGNYINKSAVTLSLGARETARTLGTAEAPVVIDGAVDVTDSSITVKLLGNTESGGVLDINTDAMTDLTLAQLVTAGNVEGNTVTLTATPELMALAGKYYTNARLDKSGAIKVDRTTDFYSSAMSESANGKAGLGMIDAALVKLNPQSDRSAYKNLAEVLDALDAAVVAGDSAAADKLGAAVGGASVAAMGAAVAGDLERQLMGIRNRTTTMGVDQSKPNQDMPYFNAWINAEGDFRRMDEDGTAAGYELNSWGGTVGFDADITPYFTMGLAATAMYGDFTAKSAEQAEGDLDTYYVTAFARYAAHRWSHTFVATVGMAETSLKRTVTHAEGGYSAEGDSDAISFGFLYELGYVAAINESATACLQPVFNVMFAHSSLGGYTETGSDAALTTGDADMTTVTFGLGARAQAQVGTSLYNRSSLLEGRALLKVRAGDREAEASNALSPVSSVTADVASAELGAIGVELGAGITIPMGSESGSVFADASVELGGGYTNINATVGYRINF